MTNLFEASRPDGRADWRVIYEALVRLQPGKTVSHAVLLRELESNDTGRLYRAVARANRELWLQDQKSVESVRGIGYRMLPVEEMTNQALRFKKKSRRQIGNAVSVSNATDVLALTGEDRETALRLRGALLTMANAMDNTIARVADHEERITRLERNNVPR